MATRANIILDSNHYNRIWLYHHWDGYPSGLGINLMEFLEKNGNVVNDYCRDSIHLANLLIKDEKDDGYELTNDQHGDIDYLYKIDTSDRTIRAYRITDMEGSAVFLKCAKYDDAKEIEEWKEWCKDY